MKMNKVGEGVGEAILVVEGEGGREVGGREGCEVDVGIVGGGEGRRRRERRYLLVD